MTIYPHVPSHSIRGITKTVHKYTAEQAISEEEALSLGMAEKSTQLVEAGAEVYTTA